MADNIFGNRYAGNKPAWHEKGHTFSQLMNSVDAFRDGGLDYKINLMDMQIAGYPEIEVAQKAIVREPTNDDGNYRIFGVVSKDYELMQNMDIADALYDLSKIKPIETVGALGKGETIFATMDFGEVEISGDPVKQYFLVTDTRDGKTTLRFAFTPVRVVCQNTLSTGLKQATVNSAIRHQRGLQAKVDNVIGLLGKLIQAQELTNELFSNIAKTKLTIEDFAHVLEQTYPTPKQPEDKTDSLAVQQFERAMQKVAVLRADTYIAYKTFGDEQPNLADTGWAFYNAVVENEDYIRGGNSHGVANVSALFGNRVQFKERAFATVSALVK